MGRLRVLATVMAMMVVAGAPPVVAAADGAASSPLPRRIELPRGWQPEGIASDGTHLFVGSLRHGGIVEVDPRTGRREILTSPKRGRVAVGIRYDRRRDLIWVAGGATGKIRAHDADSGRRVAWYSFGRGRFLNDITISRRAVYATDSVGAELAVVPFRGRGKALPPRTAARTLSLTGDFEPVPDEFNLNGIVRDGRWLLAVQSVNGTLFRINQRTGLTRQLRVRGARLLNGDGLERVGNTLYVVRNRNDKVVALHLNPRLTAARRLGVIGHRSLDVPTTVAVALERLWAVNARFGTEPHRRTPYWITRLGKVRG